MKTRYCRRLLPATVAALILLSVYGSSVLASPGSNSAQIVAAYATDPYLNAVSLSGDGSNTTRYTVNGNERLSTVGGCLSDFNARVYESCAGSFISADRIVDAGKTKDLNSYVFTHANPINVVDPSGNAEDPVGYVDAKRQLGPENKPYRCEDHGTCLSIARRNLGKLGTEVLDSLLDPGYDPTIYFDTFALAAECTAVVCPATAPVAVPLAGGSLFVSRAWRVAHEIYVGIKSPSAQSSLDPLQAMELLFTILGGRQRMAGTMRTCRDGHKNCITQSKALGEILLNTDFPEGVEAEFNIVTMTTSGELVRQSLADVIKNPSIVFDLYRKDKIGLHSALEAVIDGNRKYLDPWADRIFEGEEEFLSWPHDIYTWPF